MVETIRTRLMFVVALTLLAAVGLVAVSRAAPGRDPVPQAGSPPVVSYQGHVQVDGSPYDGTGYFKFAIVDAAGTTTYWSNDGTGTGGGEPNGGTPLPVLGGLFNVLLGDTALTNMTQALDASAFDGTERYLRVWFSSDGSTYQRLSPDRRIAAVPYALQAQESANADTLDGQDASAFADATHTHSGLLPTGALVLGRSMSETTLIDAGFSYTGIVLERDWSVRRDVPTERKYLTTVAVDGYVYAIGGQGPDPSGCEKTNERYDPATDSWVTRAAMPTGRQFPAAAVVDGVIYVVGGFCTGAGTANEAYDPDTDSWDDTLAPMPTERWGLAAAAVDGIVYAVGGSGVTGAKTANEAYDPASDSWSEKADMPTGRHQLAAVAVDDIIYAIGGDSDDTNSETANEAYDPVADAWSTKADMPHGRQGLAVAQVDGVIYALGGGALSGNYTHNEAYHPTTDHWSIETAMREGRRDLAAAAVDGVIFAIGGSPDGGANEAFKPSLYVYRKE